MCVCVCILKSGFEPTSAPFRAVAGEGGELYGLWVGVAHADRYTHSAPLHQLFAHHRLPLSLRELVYHVTSQQGGDVRRAAPFTTEPRLYPPL